jgi:hypothetical protein
MGLPIKAIDRIFSRLAATYMAAWDRSLGAVPLSDIKTAWSYELGGFENRLQDVAWALDNLPEKPPNVIEFKKLCRLAPVTETPQLEAPKADPERLKAELAKLGHIAQRPPRHDLDWAHAIMNRVKAGDRLCSYTKWSAEVALGQHGRMSWQ